MSDGSLDLFSCNQGKVNGGRQKITGGAVVVVTMPGVVMYRKVGPPGMMNLTWTVCLGWMHSTQSSQGGEVREVPATGVICVHELLV